MPGPLQTLLLFAHLAGVTVWVGGMVFAHFALRPAAVALLAPPMRLPLMAAALARFFRLVAVAVLAIIVSGLALMASVGFARAPPAWHLMLGIGTAMALVFAFIYAALYPKLVRAVAESAWPVAAGVLDRIRRLVFINLWLGVITIAVAAWGRMA